MKMLPGAYWKYRRPVLAMVKAIAVASIVVTAIVAFSHAISELDKKAEDVSAEQMEQHKEDLEQAAELPAETETPTVIEAVPPVTQMAETVIEPEQTATKLDQIVIETEQAIDEPEPIEEAPAEPEVVVETAVGAPAYTEKELEILAIIIYQEAGGDACSDKTRQMVGEVFLNRVADPRFPDTIEAVALAKGQYGRLYWTGIKWPDRAVNPGEAHAVERAYKMAQALLDGSVDRLLPTDTIFQAEFKQGTEVVAHMDGFYFCR